MGKKKTTTDKKKHGLSRTGFYRSYIDMFSRCYNKKSARYKNYGARGIIVCKEWQDFNSFVKDMFSSWKKGLTIDRIDCNKHYYKDNCRWLEKTKQSLNRTNSIIKNGKRVAVLARENNLKANIVGNRLKKGWSLEKTLKTPVLKSGCPTYYDFEGFKLSYQDLLKFLLRYL